MAQKEDSNTTTYLDRVDVPPIINQGPRPVKSRGQEIPLTDLSASAANGLGKDYKIDGINVSHVETVVEQAVAMPS